MDVMDVLHGTAVSLRVAAYESRFGCGSVPTWWLPDYSLSEPQTYHPLLPPNPTSMTPNWCHRAVGSSVKFQQEKKKDSMR